VGRRRRHGRAFIQRLAQAFVDPARFGAWNSGGAVPRVLMAEIGALLSSADVGAAVKACKAQLEDVRAFLSHRQPLVLCRDAG